MINVNILTLFPDLYPGALGSGITGRALENNLWSLNVINIRDFATDNYKKVDDTPFGGGAGMVLKPDVLSRAIESIPAETRGNLLAMSPRGRVFDQRTAHGFSALSHITILCARYEGIDQRILDYYAFQEISIGDYVLSNGDIAAMVMLDSCIRLRDGAVGNAETIRHESHENGLLEHPHYTRPADWNAPDNSILKVPEVLKCGHHKNIADWRQTKSEELTKVNRPDLWQDLCKKHQDSL